MTDEERATSEKQIQQLNEEISMYRDWNMDKVVLEEMKQLRFEIKKALIIDRLEKNKINPEVFPKVKP